jgi:hypothetical protein
MVSPTADSQLKPLRNIFGNVWVLLGIAAYCASLALLWQNNHAATDLLPNLKEFVGIWGI